MSSISYLRENTNEQLHVQLCSADQEISTFTIDWSLIEAGRPHVLARQ